MSFFCDFERVTTRTLLSQKRNLWKLFFLWVRSNYVEYAVTSEYNQCLHSAVSDRVSPCVRGFLNNQEPTVGVLHLVNHWFH